MKLPPLFPYFLVGLLALSIAALWAAVSFQQTVFVQAFYVATIFIAFGVFVAAVCSSVGYAVNRFKDYLGSGYPIMLAITLLAYGIYKSAPQITILVILVSGLMVGYFIAGQIPRKLYRFVPLVTIVASVIVGQLPIWREGKALLLGICAGLLAALAGCSKSLKHWRNLCLQGQKWPKTTL